MPTSHPRYTITDTGEMREMLNLAHQRWPEIADRRQLLLQLAGVGAERVASELDAATSASQREQQREALARAADLVDVGTLLSDAAWR